MALSYGFKDRMNSGKKYQSLNTDGKTPGAFFWRTFIKATIITINKIGPNTAAMAIQEIRDSPNTAAGNMKNTTTRYKIENHLYFAVWFPKNFAIGIGKRRYGIGKNRMIPEMLKNKWHKAICNEFGMASSLCAKAAKMAVVVVPILAPSVSGYILSMATTPMPTSGVRADVNTELDCTKIVRPVPIRMAR